MSVAEISAISGRSGPAPPVAGRAAAIAARQHGVACRRQLLALGLSSATIARWVHAGHLHTVHRGVYAVGHPNLPREGRWMAAALACGEGAALSHGATARLVALDRSRALGAIHLSLPPGSHRNPPGLIVHRPRRLDPVDLTRWRGIPTTTATRCLFDQATVLGPAALREQFERAEYLCLLDRERLAVLLDGAGGRRGLGNLRTLAGFRPLPLSETRSRLERIILSACRTYGLPLPAVNVPLLDYEVDFFWPAARFVVEADGGQHRGAQRDRDNERDVTLARADRLVRRYSGEALADERAVAREIAEILCERLAAPDPDRR